MVAPRALLAIGSFALALMLAAPPIADAQGMLGRVKKKAEEAAKKKVEDRAEKKAGESTDTALDKVECKVSDQACIDKAQAEGKEVVTTEESGGSTTGGGNDVNTMKPGQGAWANYDFKPGDQILFFDDLSKDEVGDFPRRMEFSSGSLEIVEWQGGRWLRANADSKFYIPLPEVRPERFTMEFDYFIPTGEVWITFSDQESTRLDFRGAGGANLSNSAAKVNASFTESGGEPKIRRARLMVDGKYAKVYLDDKRVLNVPNANLERSNKILFNTDGDEAKPSLFGNFRLAAGGKKLYDAIAASGRVATQGIYFESGSDRVRPESSPTLKEIAQMLAEHPDLAITIEGHTDNVGSSQANHELSHQRAAAVKQALVSTYNIDASRLTSTGFGDKKPVAKNDTPEGRQQNRRVELVKS